MKNNIVCRNCGGVYPISDYPDTTKLFFCDGCVEKLKAKIPDPDEVVYLSDIINSPSHYCKGDIEVIEVIKDQLGDGFYDYCLGNVLKYVCRAKYKGRSYDLKKAQVYLGWMING